MTRSRSETDPVARHAIPPVAASEWAALSLALVEHGPAPCEESSMPEAWWPSSTSDRLTPWELDAVRECRRCPAANECLAFSLAAGESEGTWGGLLPAERRRLMVA